MSAPDRIAGELASIRERVDAILRLLVGSGAGIGGGYASEGEGAGAPALLAAVFALSGDAEFTTAELLSDVDDAANASEGRAVRRALAAVGVDVAGATAAHRVGAYLRDIHRRGGRGGGLRLVQSQERNRRGVTVWRVVQDVSPATSGTRGA